MASRMSKVFKPKAKEFASLSSGFDAGMLTNNHLLAHFGIAGEVLVTAYEQVQSLLAIATSRGIYVLGQNGVEVFYRIAAGQQAVHLCIHKSHLVVIDTRQMLYTWSLEERSLDPVATQALRGVVMTTYAEPSLDWLFLGMKDGSVLAWDLIGEQISSAFKIKNQYFDRQEDWRLMGETYAVPRYHISPVISLCIHPADLGMLLITYADGACLFSFKENTTKAFFECIISAHDNLPERKPAVTCSSFSPDGQFVVIGCIDGTFAFYSAQDADVALQVRTLDFSDIQLHDGHAKGLPMQRYDPIVDLKWCCRTSPDVTFLVVAGGLPNDIKGLSILDYGKTTSKASELSEFFATPQRQKILPLTRDSVLSLQPLGTASPYHLFHDPQCFLIINALGNIIVLDMPEGNTTSAVALPPTLLLKTPPITFVTTGSLSGPIFSSLSSRLQRSSLARASLLLGGAARNLQTSHHSRAAILCSVHDGTLLRLFDITLDRFDKGPLLELDLSATMPNTIATMTAMSDSTGEIAIASESGLVVVHRLTSSFTNDSDLSDAFADLSIVDPMPSPVAEAQNMLFKFGQSQGSTSPSNPFCVVSARKGEVTCLCVSDVGFVAIGYDSGYLILVDLRGPAIFYATTCDRLEVKRRESVFKKVTTPKLGQNASEYPTAISILSLALDSRMSLVAVIGTNQGRAICLELLKEANGVYAALLSNILVAPNNAPIRAVLGCNQFGEDANANGTHLAEMHRDAETPDCLILVTDSDVLSYRGLIDKISSSSVRGSGTVSSGRLIFLPDIDAVVLSVILGSSSVELFSIPDMQPLRAISFPSSLELRDPNIFPNGNIIFLEDKSSLALFSLVGHGVKEGDRPPAALFDALKQPSIPRPTISNWAWVTGTQYVKSTDLDLLISGGSRPLSARAMERLAAEAKQQALIERQTASRDRAANRATQQSMRNANGYERSDGRNTYGRMQEYGQERGERVNHVNDIYENMSKASGEWLAEIDKMTSAAKKSAGKAALKSFLGF